VVCTLDLVMRHGRVSACSPFLLNEGSAYPDVMIFSGMMAVFPLVKLPVPCGAARDNPQSCRDSTGRAPAAAREWTHARAVSAAKQPGARVDMFRDWACPSRGAVRLERG
jgi:hypothetical protein